MELKDYWRIIVQRGWIVVLAALLTTGSAYLWSISQPEMYRASARLIAHADSLDYGRTQALKERLSNYSVRIRSEETAFRVIDRLQLDQNPYDLLSRVTVSPQINDLVIQIDVKDRSPERAGEIANGFAEEFIAEVQKDNQEQQVLREDQVELEFVQRAGAGELVGPRPVVNSLAGLLLGLLAGAVIVLVLEIFDDTIKSHDDIERYLGEDLMLLGQVPPGQPDLAPYEPSRRRLI